MIISLSALYLMFMSNQAIVLVNFDYPPFGLSTISYLAYDVICSSWEFLIAAISISQDVRLLQLVRKIALQESKLLDSIGSAEVEREIFQGFIVTKKTKDSMTSETGLDTSFKENDMKIIWVKY